MKFGLVDALIVGIREIKFPSDEVCARVCLNSMIYFYLKIGNPIIDKLSVGMTINLAYGKSRENTFTTMAGIEMTAKTLFGVEINEIKRVALSNYFFSKKCREILELNELEFFDQIATKSEEDFISLRSSNSRIGKQLYKRRVIIKRKLIS